MAKGGWLGCYCSVECSREDLEGPDDPRAELIHKFAQQMQEYGIYDRRWETAEPVVDLEKLKATFPPLPEFLFDDPKDPFEFDIGLDYAIKDVGTEIEEAKEVKKVKPVFSRVPISAAIATVEEFDFAFEELESGTVTVTEPLAEEPNYDEFEFWDNEESQVPTLSMY